MVEVPDGVGSEEAGDEPDYRFTLANERTFLAWMRTALALLAGGVALQEVANGEDPGGGRTALALGAIAVSAVAVGLAYRQWAAAQRAMRHGEPIPPSPGIVLVAVALVALAVGAALFVATA